jgi:hypothetical protein
MVHVLKKVTKELNAVAKRKCSNDDDDSMSSLHMLENKMKDVDDQLKNFNFEGKSDGQVRTMIAWKQLAQH